MPPVYPSEGVQSLAFEWSNALKFLAVACSMSALILLAILGHGYSFGTGDHNDLLPIIYRMMDPTYLQHDWYVTITSGFNPRTPVSWIMIGFARILGLDASFLLVYLVTTSVLAATGFIAARHIWASAGVAFLAVLILLFNREAGLLGASRLVLEQFVPTYLISAFAPLGGWLLYRGRHGLGTALFGVLAFLHPLAGSEAAVLFACAAVFALPGVERRRLLIKLPALALLIAMALGMGVLLKRGSSVEVDQAALINILAFRRAPWHYVAWMWPSSVWKQFAGFALMVLVARLRTQRSAFLDAIMLLVCAGCIIGQIAFIIPALISLVELQPFRMVIFIQFAGALYLASYLWDLLHGSSVPDRAMGGVLVVGLLIGQRLPSPFFLWLAIAVACYEALQYIAQRWPSALALRLLPLLPLIMIAVHLAIRAVPVLRTSAGIHYGLMALLGAGAAFAGAWIIQAPRPRPEALICTALACFMLLTALITAWRPMNTVPVLSWVGNTLQMHVAYTRPISKVGQWAREETPTDAVFLIPPAEADFRLTSARAIVVDFTLPLSDEAMMEWNERIYDLAGGQTLTLGYPWVTQIRDAYNGLTQEQLIQLANKYGATYIVVNRPTKLTLPQLYIDSRYAAYKVE